MNTSFNNLENMKGGKLKITPKKAFNLSTENEKNNAKYKIKHLKSLANLLRRYLAIKLDN